MTERFGTVVLDSQAMSSWLARDRGLLAMLQVCSAMGADFVVGANTLVEIMRTGVNEARLDRLLAQVRVEAVTERTARASARLLKRAGLHGHEYAIAATVAEMALRQPGPVAMLTSGPDGMARLCGDRIRLIGL